MATIHRVALMATAIFMIGPAHQPRSLAYGQMLAPKSRAVAFRLRCDISPNGFKELLLSLRNKFGVEVAVNDVMVRYRVVLLNRPPSEVAYDEIVRSAHELDTHCAIIRLPPLVEEGKMKIPTGDLVIQFKADIDSASIAAILEDAHLKVVVGPSVNMPKRYLVRDRDDDIERLLHSATLLATNKVVLFAEPDVLEVLGGR